jgi:hypothetical protein
VHTLRKRLQDLYGTGEGTSHSVRILIPAGGYAVQFLHMPKAASPDSDEPSPVPSAHLVPLPDDHRPASLPLFDSESAAPSAAAGLWQRLALFAVLVLLTAAGILWVCGGISPFR